MTHAPFRIVGASDVGQKRPTNEDHLLLDEGLGVIVLADGMGGHNAGEVASQMAVTCVMDQLSLWLRKSKTSTVEKSLSKAIARSIDLANRQIYQVASADALKRGMGTTLVVAVCYRGMLTVAHIGDSRAYLFRNDRLIPLTKDHSRAQELIDAGLLTKEHARNSHLNNILTRAVGVQENVQASYVQVDLKKGDRAMLCSDGLSNMVPDSRIEEILWAGLPLDDSLFDLIETANGMGGTDNITVALGAYE